MHVTSVVIDKLYRREQKKHNSNTHKYFTVIESKRRLWVVLLYLPLLSLIMYIRAGIENASLRTLTKSTASHQTQLQNFSGWQSNP